MDQRPRLPSIDRLLSHPALAAARHRWAHRVVVEVARQEVERRRQAVRRGAAAPDEAEIARACAERLEQLARPRPRPVLNATGVVIHTNLGRAPLSATALEWMAAAASGYSNLEYDLESGARGHRHDHVDELFSLLFPQKRALVVNNNAAALVLALNTLALGREVLVSRGELIEIGGSFRIPEILERAGVRLREVGTTNRTHRRDYERHLGPDAALLLKVWPSNYRIVGFTREVGVAELADLGRRAGIPVLADQGCGRLFRDQGAPETEPSVEQLLDDGADLVCFSGDKLLGGPQSGLLVGSPDVVARCAANPLARALRPDKLILAALAATCVAWVGVDPAGSIPVAGMIGAGPDALRRDAGKLAAALRRAVPAARVEVAAGTSRVGGGAAPEEDLPTWVVAFRHPEIGDEALLGRLRQGDPPLVARAQEGAVVFDPRTLAGIPASRVAALVATAVARSSGPS